MSVNKQIRHFLLYLSCKRPVSVEDKNDNKIPKINAHKNPSMWMPETNLPARITIKTLMTKRNIPSVMTVIGKVRIIRSGLTIAFKIPSTKTKINEVL